MLRMMLCFSLYSVTCVKLGTTALTYPCFPANRKMCHQRKMEFMKIHLCEEVEATECGNQNRHEHRNSKLIVKAHKTLILWVDFVLKKGFKFQCYLLMHGRSFNFCEISAFSTLFDFHNIFWLSFVTQKLSIRSVRVTRLSQ